MSAIETRVILCEGCQRKFAWKPELAGKRVKCKCGQKIAVPAAVGPVAAQGSIAARQADSAAVEPAATPQKKKPVSDPSEPADLDGLFALAEDAERAAAVMPIEIRDAAVIVETLPVAKSNSRGSIPLAYQSGQTALQRQKALQAAAALVDPVRDLYAPLGVLAAGICLYLGYFIYRFHLPSSAVMPVGIGVLILTAIKAALLVGFALLAAGPLGVSFGGLWHAILKLAAIAVFADGVTAWVDVAVAKMFGGVGGGGIFSWGIIGWPVALGTYWGLLIYLFSMDPGDSWLVVVCLSVFDRIMRTVLVMLLLESFLSWGGVAMPSTGFGTSSSQSSTVHNSALSTQVDGLKESGSLSEARKYIADGHQAILSKPTDDWYAAGCPNVWFEMSARDINGRRSSQGVIIELPVDKTKRAKCYDILKQYYKEAGIDADPSDFQDTGETYLQVMMR